MSFKTVGFVINRAIQLAQLDSSSDFLVLARQYYNLALDNVTSTYDWPLFRVQSPDTPFTGVRSYNLPADYSRSDTCFLIDPNGNSTRITIISKYRFDLLSTSTLSGDPRFAYIDLNNLKIFFNSAPTTTRYWRLTYFRHTAEIDDQGADDTDLIDYDDPMFPTYKVAAMLLDYINDDRAQMFHSKADKILSDNKLLSLDEDNDSVMELAPRFRQGSRPSRGGGSGWNF